MHKIFRHSFRYYRFVLIATFTALMSFSSAADISKFNKEKDLLLFNFDLKTDVDDVHTIAALDLLLKADEFSNLNYYAVSGTYGVQAGLYVPANKLFSLVFDSQWTDAHNYRQDSINKVVDKISVTLKAKGKIWIAEAGQSDFTNTVLNALERKDIAYDKNQIFVVQHSQWNEKETSVDALRRVQESTTYIKIADGNKEGNGTPGFNDANYSVKALENSKLITSEIWREANKISAKYNGINGRYNNKSIANGGADFSDLVETFYILQIENVPNVEAFFQTYNKP